MKYLIYIVLVLMLFYCAEKVDRQESEINDIIYQMTTEEKLRMIGGVNYMECILQCKFTIRCAKFGTE